MFKPTTIKDFTIRRSFREWNNKQKAALLQQNIFEKRNNFEVVRKLPYKFSYVFSDINGQECTLMNEDWELGALFWNCLERNGGNEAISSGGYGSGGCFAVVIDTKKLEKLIRIFLKN